MEEQIKKLANTIVNYSCNLKKGQKMLIECQDNAQNLVSAIIKEVYACGGYPFVRITNKQIERNLLIGTSREHCQLCAKYMFPLMDDMDAYVGISSDDNVYELSDVDDAKMQLFSIYYSKPIHRDVRVAKTKWLILKFPSKGIAQLSHKSTVEFEKFYFDVCNLDYKKMGERMEVLKALMQKTDKVHIKSPNTDLSFSIKGIPAIKCAGEMNIPDGEVYTAPVKNSVNGKITYNIPSLYDGKRFDNVSLTFLDGKIVDAECSSGGNLSLNKILDTDEGSRYIGEFSFGLNPYIVEPMLDILFDEKMCGSIHFTPGASYADAFNGNTSAVHWDLVLNQREEYGGGEIWFDDVLIRKDGIFVPTELKPLNPENLK